MKKFMNTGTEDLIAFIEDGLGVITLNRPEARNAMSNEMNIALAQILADFENDTNVGALILTGAGDAFSAGGDVKGMVPANSEERRMTQKEAVEWQRINQLATVGKLYKMTKPVIAVLPGAAVGAGMSLALACDFRIFSESAFISSAFVKVGLAGDYGGTYFLSKLVGMAKAKEIYYFSDKVDANECKHLGIANWVIPREELEKQSMNVARRLANGPKIALRHIKETLMQAYDGACLEDCLELELIHHHHTRTTEDFKEAVSAFIEKRVAVFKGI